MKIRALISLGTFLLLMIAGRAWSADSRPNLIIIMVDDMGFSDLGCFGSPDIQTPEIDRLASEGLRFTQFYVNAPICSPSRVAITTGQYPQRWKITSYLNNRKSNQERGMSQWLDQKAPILARALQKAGYATGHFGKWHMGGQRDVDDAPRISEYGFDASLTNFEGMGAKLLPLTLKPGQDPAMPGRIWEAAERLGGPVTWMQRSEITGGFVQAALEWMDRARAEGKPFFINVWPDDVHSPFFPPVSQWGDGGKRALYRGVLEAMDRQLGLLFDKVRSDPELNGKTLILLCSDNGHEAGAGRSLPLRSGKTWLYEGGIRSPLIVWGPRIVERKVVGKVNDQSVFCALDLNRSLYSVAGVGVEGKLDGEDLSQTLLGKEQRSRCAPIFWSRPPDRPGFGFGWQEDNPDLAVRHQKWKYLVNQDGSDPQLYDLEVDAEESRNLVEQHPEVVGRLDHVLREWAISVQVDPFSGD